MLPLALLPTSVVLSLDGIVLDGATVTLLLRTASATASCPGCGQPSHRVHSRYTRTVRDLPTQGRPTLLRLTARKFFCRNPDCPRSVFCERLPDLVPRYACSTARLIDANRARCPRPAARARCRSPPRLSMPASADTLLRRIKQDAAAPPAEAPRVIGVDDLAIRKGQTYGTILIDLERGKVIELLPGRDGAGLKTWLGKHPPVEVLCRDRWAAFAEAATEAAPQARQVADRWHLLKNAREALERFLDRHAGKIRDTFAPPPSLAGGVGEPEVAPGEAAASPAAAPTPDAPCRVPTAKQQRRLERYREVRRRHERGESLRQIACDMRLCRSTVLRYANSDRCPDWRPGRGGPSVCDGHRERIDAWLAAGNRNVSDRHRRLTAEGLGLRYDALRRFVLRRLGALGGCRQRAAPPPPPPSARALSFAVIAESGKRTPGQRKEVESLAGIAEVAEAVGLAERFAALVRERAGAGLKRWQEEAAGSGCAELRRFAEGLARDQAAVEAALAEAWSNGPVEGQVNRLKTIKRQMYGRAGFELLRQRVLHQN